MRLGSTLGHPGRRGETAMAKGMNKRKEVKKPKKEAPKAPVKVSSTNAKVTISQPKPKD
jgi:hypothetical protein